MIDSGALVCYAVKKQKDFPKRRKKMQKTFLFATGFYFTMVQ